MAKPCTWRTRDFSNANPMDPEQILKNEAQCKNFIGLFPEEFNILFDFLGEAKYALNYWNASNQRKINVHYKTKFHCQKKIRCL